MNNKNEVGIMLYGEKGEERNIFFENKYKLLAEKMIENNISVDTINYNEFFSEQLFEEIIKYKAILVWINPIEKNLNRQNLDNLLIKVANEGIYVSTHPNTILKIGTKDILYQTKDMAWANDINIYKTYKEFKVGIVKNLEKYGTRIIKPYRGNGGKGVLKISDEVNDNKILIQYAEKGIKDERISRDDFFNRYEDYFEFNDHLIDQEWCRQITNGMVRCYLTLNKVVGFGYQEINALYPIQDKDDFTKFEPSKRYYFTEACGLFSDLKIKMESQWISQLMSRFSLAIDDMPIIWDADFFIDDIQKSNKKYILCEINVSSVSPFPDSAILPIIEVLKSKI